jgi:hypothetical protein
VLGLALIGMAEPLGGAMSGRLLEHLLQARPSLTGLDWTDRLSSVERC